MRAVRMVTAAVVLAASALPTLAGRAAGESLGDLKDQLADIQAELDALTVEIDDLKFKESELGTEIDQASAAIERMSSRNARLQKKVIKRAKELYMAGDVETFEALLGAESFSDLSNRAEMLSQVSSQDNSVFIDLHRSVAEQERLRRELSADRVELSDTLDARIALSDNYLDRYEAVEAEYKRLLAQIRVEEPDYISAPANVPKPSGDMTCPVAGPVSFTSSFGDPRSGHTHQGNDMMAAYGTPVVAIVSGSITYSGYHGSAGNWQILSGNDGNAYYYMHNQQNIITGGSVSVGQQIATVGDTGNAVGTPHLHFEYHPGGGAAVDPYPLLTSIC
ncbi:MAG: murein hydrolase activator EnvC family protein [Actinomycetota bacterium]